MPSETEHNSAAALPPILDLLRCPATGAPLVPAGNELRAGNKHYRVTDSGIPLFAEELCSPDGRAQQQHYDRIAQAYVENLTYPHTEEYMNFLDRMLLAEVDPNQLGTVAELCCGHGEAFYLLGKKVLRGLGVDVSQAMLDAAVRQRSHTNLFFVQGDATMLPLADAAFDSVFMLGGVHHVNDRPRLFREVHRILKPGGRFYFREPVSDFILWRALRAVIYRLSPALDHNTERPLLYEETVPVLEHVGLRLTRWKTFGFIGFCLFMNSDVLLFNRLFRFLPGIREVTRAFVWLDECIGALPGLSRAGLQLVGVATKPSAQG
jgi:ubiquinone/menaquinone biosynthesis C-methylase UbiE